MSFTFTTITLMTILDLTKQLVRIRSLTSDQSACKEVLEHICSLFAHQEGIYIDRFEQEGVHSVVIKNFDGKRADVCFNAHVDVVPPQDESQREPTERDGMLWGRGCWDMKDGVALISLLMKELTWKPLTTNKLMLLITADEETWGKHGAEYLTQDGYGADVVLIPDGGNRHEVVIGEKWVINLTLTATWKAGHSSKPRKYENAIEKLYIAYTRIKETVETPLLYEEPDHRWCSVQLTTIQWGQVTNMIPGEASWTLNIRYTESTSYEWIIRRIEQIAAEIGNITFRVDMHGGLLFTDPSHRIITQYLGIAQKHLGEEVMLAKEHGASDGRFFADQGAVVILQKPTCFDIHGAEERTTIADLEDIYKVYKEFVLTYAS